MALAHAMESGALQCLPTVLAQAVEALLCPLGSCLLLWKSASLREEGTIVKDEYGSPTNMSEIFFSFKRFSSSCPEPENGD